MNPQEIVKVVCGDFYVAGKTYHTALPPELALWYAYCSDGGHCLVCLLEKDSFQPEEDLIDYLLPVPVKSVWRGYRIQDKYIVTDHLYEVDRGLVTPPEDDEF